MNRIFHYKRTGLTIAVLSLGLVCLTRCVHPETEKKVAPGNEDRKAFAGSASCAGCHRKIYDSHMHTAHFLSTRPATQEYIKGSFEEGKNKFEYDSGRTVIMEKRDSGFYQVGYYQGTERISRRFDIVVGSGAKGQTYITRVHKQLNQLPVSYFTAAHNWANSPLYPMYPVLFNRTITSRCLECHSSYAHVTTPPDFEPEEFDTTMTYGIDCEKCHGPAARHVEFQTRNPDQKKGNFILNPATFTRQQSLDLCALCHGGRLQKTKPSFTFGAGDKLADYFVVDTTAPDPDHIDVHGNQYGLLRSSRCFKMNNTMTCTTCHNPHENERGQLALFSARCITCHNGTHEPVCKMTAQLGASIVKNCIDCHMPLKPSHSITEMLPGDREPTAAMIRSHLIKIYPKDRLNHKTDSQQAN